MAYPQMGSGQDYSKNATYTAVGPSSFANHGNHLGVMTFPESLAEYPVPDPSNNLENHVKGKGYTCVDKSRGLFPSQTYVPDFQVSAVSATGLQNVDGFGQSGLNGTANFQPSMAYQQMGSGVLDVASSRGGNLEMLYDHESYDDLLGDSLDFILAGLK